jgi:hypothetical protein
MIVNIEGKEGNLCFFFFLLYTLINIPLLQNSFIFSNLNPIISKVLIKTLKQTINYSRFFMLF